MKMKRGSVILIHGLLSCSGFMKKMEKALQDAGYFTENLDYPSRKYTIPVLVEKFLVGAVRRCREQIDGPVYFVTHSMGGILARYYLSTNFLPSLGRVVMLAPPNHGSEIVDRLADKSWCKRLFGPAGCSLGTGTDSIIHQLGRADYPLGIITGNQSFDPCSLMLPKPNDGKVSVDSAKLEGMDDFLLVPYAHSFIMRKKKVIDEVIYFFQEGRFQRNS